MLGIRALILAWLVTMIASCAILEWRPDYYIVQPRDTLYSIAWRYGLDYRELAEWNNISPSQHIHPGQELVLSPQQQPVNQSQSSKSAQRKNKKNRDRKVVRSNIDWQWPVKGRIVKKFAAANSAAQGIDIQTKEGAPVYAAASGRVVYSGDALAGYGNLIIIKHDDLYLSAYAHNKKLLSAEGEKVGKGQKIATVGRNVDQKTVLHFEIRKNGKPIDPLNYLPRLN